MNEFLKIHKNKSGKVSDKWTHYFATYDQKILSFKNLDINLLEIGVQNGGSLEVWAEYFPKARKIIGCDINLKCANLSFSDPRISTIIGDANTDEIELEINSIASKFNLIVDDGSHSSGDIVKSFVRYFKALEFGGVYIVEDLHCSYWQDYEGGLYDPYSSISFFKRLVDICNYEHWGSELTRRDFLSGFEKKYSITFDEDILGLISSIEFSNSICIIFKNDQCNNLLGARVIGGVEEVVMPGVIEGDGKTMHEKFGQHTGVPSQNKNPWSRHYRGIEEPYEEIQTKLKKSSLEIMALKNLVNIRDDSLWKVNQQLLERELLIDSLYASTSWKISSPIRAIGWSVRKVHNLILFAQWQINDSGGFLSAILNICKGGIRRPLSDYRSSRYSISNASIEFNPFDYSQWLNQYEFTQDISPEKVDSRITDFIEKPLISIILPVYNPNLTFLSEAIDSVLAQIYPHWQLCIVDDASSNSEVVNFLAAYQRKDKRIKIFFREDNGHISKASNTGLSFAEGEWILFLDHDDKLSKTALFWIVDSINTNKKAKIIYSDEDKLNECGNRVSPYFKPAWNRDLLYSHNYFCHLTAYKKELIKEVGGFRVGFEGAQDYDLLLRCLENIGVEEIVHVPRILYHWRIHRGSTAKKISNKSYAAEAGKRALNEHFARIGVRASAEIVDGGYRINYELPEILPLVSLIIPTKNSHELVRQCIESINSRTTYKNYEIILIDNNSDNLDSIKFFKKLESDGVIKLIHYPHTFNYSAINNYAVKYAAGEIVALVNNDVEVISPNWLSEMVSIALQDGVGAVGAKLLYADGTIQHGGVVVGLGGVAGHSHKYLDGGSPGFCFRAKLISSFSAVTAACLVVRKSIYTSISGLNEVDLPVAFNDVDFCLRLKEAGYRNVWTPYAQLYHHESVTRGHDDTEEKILRFQGECEYMKLRWSNFIENDPAYSPNLTIDREDFSYSWPPRVREKRF